MALAVLSVVAVVLGECGPGDMVDLVRMKVGDAASDTAESGYSELRSDFEGKRLVATGTDVRAWFPEKEQPLSRKAEDEKTAFAGGLPREEKVLVPRKDATKIPLWFAYNHDSAPLAGYNADLVRHLRGDWGAAVGKYITNKYTVYLVPESTNHFVKMVLTGWELEGPLELIPVNQMYLPAPKNRTVATAWKGSVLVGDKIYAAPHDSDYLLIYDTVTDTVSGVPVPEAYHGQAKKWHGVAYHEETSSLYFAPCNAGALLIYTLDEAAETPFKTEKVPGQEGVAPIEDAWHGIAPLGDLVVAAPYNAKGVLVYNTVDTSLRLQTGTPGNGEPSIKMDWMRKWSGAALYKANGSPERVVMAPHRKGFFLTAVRCGPKTNDKTLPVPVIVVGFLGFACALIYVTYKCEGCRRAKADKQDASSDGASSQYTKMDELSVVTPKTPKTPKIKTAPNRNKENAEIIRISTHPSVVKLKDVPRVESIESLVSSDSGEGVV